MSSYTTIRSLFLFITLVTTQFLIAGEVRPYERNPNVSEKEWDRLSPYFLPEDSWERKALDSIFKKRRAINSLKSMRKSGFLVINPKGKICVARHYKLQGYVVKAYLDDFPINEGDWWKKRIDGARLIQNSIDAHNFQHLMKVPKKWIYPLPSESEAKEGKYQHNFILIAEDFDPLLYEANMKAYKKKMTPELLKAYYVIITENLLIDSIYADNLPFCRDGKLAFIDTEHTMDYSKPIPYEIVNHKLSSKLLPLWLELVKNGQHTQK